MNLPYAVRGARIGEDAKGAPLAGADLWTIQLTPFAQTAWECPDCTWDPGVVAEQDAIVLCPHHTEVAKVYLRSQGWDI